MESPWHRNYPHKKVVVDAHVFTEHGHRVRQCRPWSGGREQRSAARLVESESRLYHSELSGLKKVT